MAINSGVNISKTVGYAVLSIPLGVDITKTVGYAVLGVPQSPVWPAFTMPNGYVNVAYYIDWDLSPATTPTTYSVLSGSLPTGLSLTSISDDKGKIDGTPTVVGTYSFTLRATNSFGTADKAFSITVNNNPVAGGSYVWMA